MIGAMKTFRVIGDIHGLNYWEELIDLEAINIFVGDYFDPYTNIPFEEMKDNFLKIIEYKKQYPDNFILLYGNHDFQYIQTNSFDKYSRYNMIYANEIKQLLLDNDEYMHGICYVIDNYVITHAGITKEWAERYLPKWYSLDKLEEFINLLWNMDKSCFSFNRNAPFWDSFGEACTNSPIWIRPSGLIEHNVFTDDTIQIVGHTHVLDVTEEDNIIFVDCLRSKINCFKNY